MYDVVSVGSAVIDYFLKTIPTEIYHHEICFITGGKVDVSDVDLFVGGTGMNVATSLSRLGLKTALFSVIGKDDAGKTIKQKIKEENITFVGKLATQTSMSIILDAKGQDRTILSYKGEANNLSPSDVKLPAAKWIYLSSMQGKSFHATKQAVLKHPGKLAFNPRVTLIEKEPRGIKELLKKTNILLVNKEEAQSVCFATNKLESEHLLEVGPELVVVTDGAKGAIVYTKNKTYTIVPRKNIPIVETTGAGDSFSSAFVGGIIQELPIETALKMGMANAESVITHYGASNILLSKTQIKQRLKHYNVVTR
ncbi:MAG: carbohydrate kinase family protein [Candidatus Woesearchaeota archaeon]|nr:MAG: carbohydrate kinase family protein [Candidatus Woesearchaeota archaeon]